MFLSLTVLFKIKLFHLLLAVHWSCELFLTQSLSPPLLSSAYFLLEISAKELKYWLWCGCGKTPLMSHRKVNWASKKNKTKKNNVHLWYQKLVLDRLNRKDETRNKTLFFFSQLRTNVPTFIPYNCGHNTGWMTEWKVQEEESFGFSFKTFQTLWVTYCDTSQPQMIQHSQWTADDPESSWFQFLL